MKIDNALQELSQAIAQLDWRKQPANLYQPIEYLLGIGGKRMRPLLALIGCRLFADSHQQALRPSLAVEVFHNFTLMHDDIMDKAPLRRNMATVHEKWNTNIAILSGDAMLIEAYNLLLDLEPMLLKTVIKLFNRCALDVCEGQQEDMDFEQRAHVPKDEYIEMIRKKTAVLLGFSLEMGALIGGASEQEAEKLREFGINIGIAFQLRDDLLDVYGNPATFGKQVGGDILSNKKTFLLIHALEYAKGKDADALQHWLSLETFDAQEKITAVTDIYNHLEIKELTQQQAQLFFEKGMAQLQALDVPEARKMPLAALAQQLMERES